MTEKQLSCYSELLMLKFRNALHTFTNQWTLHILQLYRN